METETSFRSRISGHTQLLTLMAYPIRHSGSPAMHNEAARYLGLDYVYLCFDVDQSDLKEAIDAMRTLNIRGGNFSMPNKIAVIPLLDRLSQEAKMCGAVNTVVNDDGVLTGYNTDGIGYTQSLRDRGIDPKGKKITVLGAGGAGKAVQVQLALEGVKELYVFNRHDEFYERAQETVGMINEKTRCRASFFDLEDKERLRERLIQSDILTNATSVGMAPNDRESCIPDASFLHEDLAVTDVVYFPEETTLLKQAKEAGCRSIIGGKGMMLFQGASSFKLWTGKEMPIAHMKDFLGLQNTALI